MIWSWLALGCGGVLLVRLDWWYYVELSQEERAENERNMRIW